MLASGAAAVQWCQLSRTRYSFATPPVWRAFLYADGSGREIEGLAGTSAWAWDINDQGDIVGETGEHRGPRRGFVLASGKVTRVGTLGGESSAVYALNNRGDFAGSSSIAGEAATHGFVSLAGAVWIIHPLGGTACYPKDINERGDVVGESTLRPEDPGTGGFLVRDGQLWPLPLSTALALNDRGDIVGAASAGVTFFSCVGRPPTPPSALRLGMRSARTLRFGLRSQSLPSTSGTTFR